jgi:hypothetical protein
MTELLQQFGLEIARIFGQGLGWLTRLILELLLVYLIWGLPWHNIFVRAGFPKRGVMIRLGLMLWPWFAFVITQSYNLPQGLSEFLSFTAIASFYIGLLSVAIPRWPALPRNPDPTPPKASSGLRR